MSDLREQARQLRLAHQRVHGPAATAAVLEKYGVSPGMAEATLAQLQGLVEALKAELSTHDDDASAPASAKPQMLADLIEPAFAKFNAVGKDRFGRNGGRSNG